MFPRRLQLAKSTAARASARLKQLSCFGLGKEVVIPELLRELHALVPSFSNTFHFADERGVVNNIYFENTDLVKFWPLYQEKIFERHEREYKGLAFSDGSRKQFGIHEFREAVLHDRKTFQRSDYYNLVARPVGYDSNFLRVYFRLDGRVLGGLTLWRAPSATNWTPEDKRRLGALESFFLHALTVPTPGETDMVDGDENGLIIANSVGKPVYFSGEGRRLLFLAASPQTIASRSAVLPAPVAQICRNLSRIFSNDASAADAPIHYHVNVWGGFTFRAHWLHQEQPGSGLIGITISRKIPVPIRLLRSVQKLSLSRRQAEVCVWMANGASNQMVSERLGISRHTANEHARWIYNKLDVHNRAELVSKLLSAS